MPIIVKDNHTIQFTNCRLLRDHKIHNLVDLWIRNGKVIDPEKVFYDEQIFANEIIDCKGAIIAPGFIDIQINGGFGVDFANNIDNVEQGISLVAKEILSNGVTSFCPTLVTSPTETYHKILPQISKKSGGKNGAAILGVHVEGPFINVEKKGAHKPEFIIELNKGIDSVMEVYGSLDNIKIITMAPEKPGALNVISELTKRNVIVAIGHSMGHLQHGEMAVENGANLITHLFNAMLPFHHRDPGLVGLLTSDAIPTCQTVYYGIISDGVHTHPSALRIAYRSNPNGMILVTDAISALGLSDGVHYIGQFMIEVRDRKAYIGKTSTLCGSIAPMDECVRIFYKSVGCSREFALEAASLHPAQCLRIDLQKGTLNFGADGDFIFLDDELNIISTWIAGECVYEQNEKNK